MKYLWKMKNGRCIDVDEMSTEHLRNTLKMIIRNNEKNKEKREYIFQLEGDMAEEFNRLQDEEDEAIWNDRDYNNHF